MTSTAGSASVSDSVCAACKVSVKRYVTCSRCNTDYHSNCLLKIPGVFVSMVKAIICCDDPLAGGPWKNVLASLKSELAKCVMDVHNKLDSLHTLIGEMENRMVNRPTVDKVQMQRRSDVARRQPNTSNKSDQARNPGPGPSGLSSSVTARPSTPFVRDVSRSAVPSTVPVEPEVLVSAPSGEDAGEVWTAAPSGRRRRRRASRAVVGTRASDAAGGLSAAPRLHHHHVFNFAPATSCDDIKNFLSTAGLSGIECVRLNSRRPEVYASFRLSAHESLDSTLTNAGFWPEGIFVKRYFFPRNGVVNNISETSIRTQNNIQN